MENVLCLLGGAVLGAIIGISLNKNDRQVKKLLHRILDKMEGGDTAELEKQMDSWLATLGKSVTSIEKVSEQVDSK